MFQGADDLLAYIKDEGVETVDIRFCDLPGVMQHFTVPATAFGPEVFEDGLAFDGSSIRGFQKIHESDMALLPDPTTAFVDPFRKSKTLAVSFFVHDPLTKEPYSRDPRNIARKAENYLASTGIGDTAFFAPEAERVLLLHRLRGRRVEQRRGDRERRPREPRLQGEVQGRLLPGGPGRPLLRPARRHGAQPAGRRA
jgi:glutamine synthetase